MRIFTSTTELKAEAITLGDEAAEVVISPFRVKDYALLTTLGVMGAVGLTYAFDGTIQTKVQGLKGNSLDKVTNFGSNVIGNPFVHLGVAFAVYGGGVLADAPKWKDTGAMLGEAVLLADAGSFIMKQVVGRARPFVSNDRGDFKPLQFKTDYDSFPSMHTASSFAMASVMSSMTENLGGKLLYYSAATFVGFSRLYQNKHWASDIIMGAALGELCGRVVVHQHSKQSSVTLIPMVSDGAYGLALTKQW